MEEHVRKFSIIREAFRFPASPFEEDLFEDFPSVLTEALRWDDWVPQDRLRKLSDENKELAANLKKEMDALRARTAPKATTSSSKKKALGSDLSSTRGSEERHSSAQAGAGPRGQKRGRDFEIEKVGSPELPFKQSHTVSFTSSIKGDSSGTTSSLSLSEEEGLVPTFPASSVNLNIPRLTPRRLRSTIKLENEEGGEFEKDLPTTEAILSRAPPTDSRRKAMLRPLPERSNVPDQHPQYYKLKRDDMSNEAKRQFFFDQDPDLVIMIAGFQPEYSLHPLTGTVSKQEEAFHARPSVRIAIPDHLKALLVDDWENVTKNLQLIPLPSKSPVNIILNTYFDEEKGKRRLGSAEADILEEVVQGIKEYFDKCLGRILLYRFEREQFFEQRQLWEAGTGEWEGKGPGDVYGAEHLFRLFGIVLFHIQLHAIIGPSALLMSIPAVSMPELIAQTNMDQQSVNRLREELTKLTQWLGKNSSRFVTGEYENASQDYIEKARGV
ncbi:MAG: Esa1p-associated factor [Pycnora praestabilis]|nr:MAG: Esa1p-associated factor [Pycnora praestabilis]